METAINIIEWINIGLLFTASVAMALAARRYRQAAEMERWRGEESRSLDRIEALARAQAAPRTGREQRAAVVSSLISWLEAEGARGDADAYEAVRLVERWRDGQTFADDVPESPPPPLALAPPSKPAAKAPPSKPPARWTRSPLIESFTRWRKG